MKWPNNSLYEGNFEQGRIEGKGIRFYENGNALSINWVKDKPDGKGWYYKVLNDSLLEVTYKDGKLL